MKKYAFLLILFGILVALSSWSLLWSIALVQEAFSASALLGWITVSSLSLIICGITYLCFTELTGYWSIRKVDKLSIALTSDDIEEARRRSLQWLHSMAADHKVDQHLLEVQSAQSVDEIRQAITTLVCLIDSKVDRMIASESVLIGAAVGISPWPFFDGAIVAWRQLRLMRSIAVRYGARPGAIGTLRLLRSVLITVVLADVSEHAMQWIASKIPSLGGLIPSAGQAVAIVVLTVRLGRACKSTSRPIAREVVESGSAFSRVKAYVSQTFQQRGRQAIDQ